MARRMTIVAGAAVALLVVSCAGVSRAPAKVRQDGTIWTLGNPAIAVEFDSQTGATAVLDKTAGYTWRQQGQRRQRELSSTPVRRLKRDVRLDGDLEEWRSVSPLKITAAMTADAKEIAGDNDCSALVYFGWNDKAFYLALDVTDDKIVWTRQPFKLWTDDSVEVWLGAEHVGFTDGSTCCWTDRRKAGSCKAAFRRHKGGYTVEMALPFAAFFGERVKGIVGAAFPFAVGVNDADQPGKRSGQIYFPRTWVHSWPETFVNAVLAGTDGHLPVKLTAMTSPRRWEVLRVRKGDPAAVRVDYAYRPRQGDEPIEVAVTMSLDSHAADLHYTIHCSPDAQPGDFAFPAGLLLPSPDGYILVPQRQGFLYACCEKNPRYEPGSRRFEWTCMRWFGAVDIRKGHGYIAIFDTPDDACFAVRPRQAGETECVAAAPVWRTQKGRFGYDRRITYHFSAAGGYVALAKRFRRHAKATGMFKSLDDKIKACPLVRTYMNAAFIDCCGINYGEMATAGRLLRGFGYPGMFTNNWCGGYPRNGRFVRRYRLLNVHPGMWKCFKDNIPKDEYDRSTLRLLPDGRAAIGWVCGDDKKGPIMSATCHARMIEHSDHYMSYFRRAYLWDFLFHDTTTACQLCECYSPEHPATRSQDKANKIALLKYLNTFGAVVGSEYGRDWAVPYLHSLHGPNELTRPPRVLVPSFNLVYHDAVIAHYRWTWTFHHGDFEQKRLYCLLYGNPPSFRWDRNQEAAERDGIFRRSVVVAKFYEQVGTKEMLSHSFLDDDFKLQRCDFAGGGVAFVNFGEKPREIEARGARSVLPEGGFFVTAGPMTGYRVLVGGKPTEYVESPDCVYVDCPVEHDFGPAATGKGGGCFTVVVLGPRRLLVTTHRPGSVRLRPARMVAGWDLATTRAFTLNADDERQEEVTLTRTRRGAVVFTCPGACELACGELARCADLALVPDSIRFSDTTPRGGEKITVTAEVVNRGEVPTVCSVFFYRDLVDDRARRFRAAPIALEPGEQATVSTVLDTRGRGLDGTYNIWAVVRSRQPEANLLNNDTSKLLSVGVHYHAKYLIKGFDFGGSKVADGFVRALNEPYTKKRGWGWSGRSPVNELGQLWEPKISETGPLLADAVACARRPDVKLPLEERQPGYGATEYTFHVDLPNGDYGVGLVIVNGVRGWQTEKFLADISIEGKVRVHGKEIEHRKGHFILDLPVTVRDGRLDVTFKGNWWQLCALTIRKD